MAEKLNLPYDWNKLEIAQAAGDYLKQGEKGLPYVQKSLELMLQDIGFSEPIAARTLSDPQIAGKAISNYLMEYNNQKQDQTIEDFMNYHGKTIEKYLGDGASRVNEELEPFMKKTYGEVFKELGKAQHIIEGDENELGLYSPEQVENAKKTRENYRTILTTISVLEDRKISALKDRVSDAVAKDVFNQLYKPKEENQ